MSVWVCMRVSWFVCVWVCVWGREVHVQVRNIFLKYLSEPKNFQPSAKENHWTGKESSSSLERPFLGQSIIHRISRGAVAEEYKAPQKKWKDVKSKQIFVHDIKWLILLSKIYFCVMRNTTGYLLSGTGRVTCQWLKFKRSVSFANYEAQLKYKRSWCHKKTFWPLTDQCGQLKFILERQPWRDDNDTF